MEGRVPHREVGEGEGGGPSDAGSGFHTRKEGRGAGVHADTRSGVHTRRRRKRCDGPCVAFTSVILNVGI
jgi:hypothetical protein